MKEAQDRVAWLQEDHPMIFGLFLQWAYMGLYHGTKIDDSPDDHVKRPVESITH